jgi:hypothetical protein
MAAQSIASVARSVAFNFDASSRIVLRFRICCRSACVCLIWMCAFGLIPGWPTFVSATSAFLIRWRVSSDGIHDRILRSWTADSSRSLMNAARVMSWRLARIARVCARSSATISSSNVRDRIDPVFWTPEIR